LPIKGAVIGLTSNDPATRTDLTYGPVIGPGLEESLKAGPVTLDNVVLSHRMLEVFDGLSPALDAPRSDTAGFLVRNGAAQRAGASAVVVRAKGDATVLNTFRVLTATAPASYLNGLHGNYLSRLIPGDSARHLRTSPSNASSSNGLRPTYQWAISCSH
jgi:hypothetical protein